MKDEIPHKKNGNSYAVKLAAALKTLSPNLIQGTFDVSKEIFIVNLKI